MWAVKVKVRLLRLLNFLIKWRQSQGTSTCFHQSFTILLETSDRQLLHQNALCKRSITNAVVTHVRYIGMYYLITFIHTINLRVVFKQACWYIILIDILMFRKVACCHNTWKPVICSEIAYRHIDMRSWALGQCKAFYWIDFFVPIEFTNRNISLCFLIQLLKLLIQVK